MQRIVFHIGTHKTGTSAIQGSLLESSEALLERGILYPRTGRGRPGHARLTDELRDSSSPGDTPVHTSLVEEARSSRASVLVISSEALSSPRSAGTHSAWARALCSELGARRSQVVAYLRPQWEWIEASYAQRVRTGLTWLPFVDYLEESLASSALDYPKRLAPWRGGFDAVDVRPYSRDLLLDGDVVDDFWRTAGLGSPLERTDAFANRRPGTHTIEMLRAIRRLLAEHRLDDLVDVRQALSRARRWIEAELPSQDPFAPLTPELVARVGERFAASNEEIVKRDFGGRHAELFNPPADLGGRPPTWTLEDASARELEVFAGALEKALSKASGGRSMDAAPEGAGTPARPKPRRGARRTRRARRGVRRLRRLMAVRKRLGLGG